MNDNKNELMDRAAFYSQWMKYLFVLVVISNLIGIVFNDAVIKDSVLLSVINSVISLLGQFAYAVILTVMARDHQMYGIAGKAYFIGALVVFGCELAELSASLQTLAMIVSLVGSVFSLVGQYHEYISHKAVLSSYDTRLSERWGKLWQWTLRCLIVMMVSIPVMLLAVGVGGMLSLVASLGMFVISVVKIVTLYQSASGFKNYLKRA